MLLVFVNLREHCDATLSGGEINVAGETKEPKVIGVKTRGVTTIFPGVEVSRDVRALSGGELAGGEGSPDCDTELDRVGALRVSEREKAVRENDSYPVVVIMIVDNKRTS